MTDPSRSFQLVQEILRHKTETAMTLLPTSPKDTANLQEDADVAWHYISRLGHPKTALPPATSWLNGKTTEIYPFITLWDIGSTLLSFISAHSMGIIKDGEFEQRTRKLFKHLHAADDAFEGRRLPKSLFAIDGSGKGRSGYDASDMGRMLVALHAYRNYTGDTTGTSSIVNGWDIASSIVDGRIHNQKNGALTDLQDSSYIDYVTTGFSLWGFPVKPPVNPGNGNKTERMVAVIEAFASMAPVGTEPHLLALIELGHSIVSETIQDLLFMELMKRHTVRGQWVSPSECPLDREPWFTYQGYQVLADDNPWRISVPGDGPGYRDSKFAIANEVISAKAAYLWQAARPASYSRGLVDWVRSKCRNRTTSFSPGVYTVSGKAMKGYSDLNTNAVIVEAINYILSGEKPIATMRAGHR